MSNILKNLIKKALKEAEIATGSECTTCKDCPGGCKFQDCNGGYCVDAGSAPDPTGIKGKDGSKKAKRKLRKERSKIEGVIGNLKKDYSMKLVTLKTKEGAEIQARIAASMFNLNRAINMI